MQATDMSKFGRKAATMLTERIVAGFILAGLVSAAIASDAKARSGNLRICQEECAGSLACPRTCGGSVDGKTKKLRLPPRPEPEPPVVKSWHDEVFARGKDGGGGAGGGR